MGFKTRRVARQSAQSLFEQGRALVPAWNEDDPDAKTRKSRALSLLEQAAELGHVGAAARLGELMWHAGGQRQKE